MPTCIKTFCPSWEHIVLLAELKFTVLKNTIQRTLLYYNYSTFDDSAIFNFTVVGELCNHQSSTCWTVIALQPADQTVRFYTVNIRYNDLLIRVKETQNWQFVFIFYQRLLQSEASLWNYFTLIVIPPTNKY